MDLRRACTATVLAIAAPMFAQNYDRSEAAGGPFSRVAVLNAPFSADAITRFRESLPDGTVREHELTARYYRNARGVVRAELETPWGPYVVLEIPRPADSGGHASYVLDPKTRTYRNGLHLIATALFNGEGRIALPVARGCFQVAPPVLAGASDSDRLRAVNAETAPDLALTITSHRLDHIGSVDYQVVNIQREEPPAELFELPKDFTLVSGSADDPMIAFAPWQSSHRCEPLSR